MCRYSGINWKMYLSLCRRTIILFYKLEDNLMCEKQPPVKRKITDCKLSV